MGLLFAFPCHRVVLAVLIAGRSKNNFTRFVIGLAKNPGHFLSI